MEKGKVIGRWYVAVVLDERWGKVVKIHDTQYKDNVWTKDYNPEGYQFVASYDVKTFICHGADKLILQGDVDGWVMSFIELYQAQVYVYENQFIDRDVKMAEHISGGQVTNLNK